MSLRRYQRGVRQLGGFAGGSSHLARPPAVLEEPDIRPRGHHCPERMFSDLYYDPWIYFAGPSADGASLWTFSEVTGDLQEWSASDLSLLTTLTPTLAGSLETGAGFELAIGPGFCYFMDYDGTDYHLSRASLTTGAVTALYNLGSNGDLGITYCHVDDGLYVVHLLDPFDYELVRYEPDGSGSTVLVAGNGSQILPAVWTSNHVWTVRDFDLIRVRISDGDVTTFPSTSGTFYGNALHSNGSVVGHYASGIDYPGFPDNDNWYFQYDESGSESIVNNRVIGVLFDEEVPGHGSYIPSPPNTQGGCPTFVFVGEIVGGGSVSSGPYPGKQDASGTSWFVSDYGTYGALWRFR